MTQILAEISVKSVASVDSIVFNCVSPKSFKTLSGDKQAIGMDGKSIVIAGYNAIAMKYLATRNETTEDILLLGDLIQRLPKGAVVLDAGCGGGVPVTRLLSQHFEVTGVDFSEAQIQLARELVPQAKFLCEDLTRLNFADETFDAICSYYAIIHIPRVEHEALLRSFWRMLKPSGLALLCMGSEDLDDDIEEDYLGARMYWSHYDSETNLKMLELCGFNIVRTTLVPDSPTGKHLFVLANKATD